MDVYLGALGLSLALIGAGAWRDRWVGFWVALAALGAVMMLGRYTFLFDRMNRVPVLGSARIPVRYHLWVTLGVAALASVGVDRLSRPGKVRIRVGRMGDADPRAGRAGDRPERLRAGLGWSRSLDLAVCAHAEPPAGRRADVGGRAIGRAGDPRLAGDRRGRRVRDGRGPDACSPGRCRCSSWPSSWAHTGATSRRCRRTTGPGPRRASRRSGPTPRRGGSPGSPARRRMRRGSPRRRSISSRRATPWPGTSRRPGACIRRSARPRSSRAGCSGTSTRRSSGAGATTSRG